MHVHEAVPWSELVFIDPLVKAGLSCCYVIDAHGWINFAAIFCSCNKLIDLSKEALSFFKKLFYIVFVIIDCRELLVFVLITSISHLLLGKSIIVDGFSILGGYL